jgi:hypothetical protein
MIARLLVVAAAFVAAGCAGMHGAMPGHEVPAGAAVARAPAKSNYEPYRFLVGEWNVGAPGGAASAVARLRWGPNESYLWYSVATLSGGNELPHFEGMLMWNGVRKNLDMLLTLDLAGGNAQEQGTVSVQPDGTVVRDITAYYSPGTRLPPRFDTPVGAEGATVQFRQTVRPEAPGRIATSLMRKSGDGWVATFPGSDNLVMTRRG